MEILQEFNGKKGLVKTWGFFFSLLSFQIALRLDLRFSEFIICMKNSKSE